MPTTYESDRRFRAPAALAAAVLEAALVYALVSGLPRKVAGEVGERLEVLTIPAQPSPSPSPPPPPPKRTDDSGAPKDKAGAAGRRAKATQIVAPPPPIAFPSPPPVVTAKVAGSGSQATRGAAKTGTGPGAGGEGQGLGGGGAGGTGMGTGRGSGGGRGARRIGGALHDADYPDAAAWVRAAGTVFIRFRVGLDGRVRGCQVTRSSGNALLDETTCRLVERRFRYRPAVNAWGEPVESIEATNFTWGTRNW